MKRALVVGCANDVWQEVEAALKLCTYDTVYAVKMAGIHWDQGPFQWPTLHPEYMEHYKAERRKLGLPDNYEIVSCLPTEVGRHQAAAEAAHRRVSYIYPGMTSSGASGLFGVKIALDDGHDRVVLAGIPMTREAAHFVRGLPWAQVDGFIGAWKIAKPHLIGRVRSFSGWTKEFLGGEPPDAAWLEV